MGAPAYLVSTVRFSSITILVTSGFEDQSFLSETEHQTERKQYRAMNSTFNIYKQLSGEHIVWVDRVSGLDQATERAHGLRAASPGNYLIYDVRERTVVESLMTDGNRLGNKFTER